MIFHVVVGVRLKEGLLDPQGKAVEAALPSLGWTNVSHVRVGKEIELEVDAPNEAAARAQVGEMAERFLSNPVIETFEILQVGGELALNLSDEHPR
jgi:phosphoribosylformylglycinamidine synthase subunit PurS